jgi:arginase
VRRSPFSGFREHDASKSTDYRCAHGPRRKPARGGHGALGVARGGLTNAAEAIGASSGRHREYFREAKYLDEIAETCKDLGEAVQKSLEENFFPLVLGGDHSIAAGAASGVASFFRKDKKDIGYIWLDAHGDMNTPESSPSGNVHGMPLASIMGYGPTELVDLMGFKPKVEPGNIVIVGARDLDAQERKMMKKSGVHVFTMREIDERGMREVMSDALKYAMDDTAGIAVSLDMDFVDPSDAPGVGTPVRGGVTYREAHLAMEMIADSEAMASLEVVEINPVIDEHNRTALLGVELILSALGKKIL